ncbi:hypothetical protein B484DRAFT_450305 [Ochromonadaceae sp. CCMP2298]|nr:hypothetical protein B484DRAFT_450305 [Ochromonadaceae sp. CCMP2298]|mmetsp:Transcript_12086/g.26921  ORF Transcript_12086/g.26921 Transcript_12086/m.26921 type:complete len:268 (-) Transcript_12086:106-909(-)
MSFLKKLNKKMNQAGEALSNMAELAQLDSIVATITKQFDQDIETFEYEGMPPSAEQADEWEEQQFKAQMKCFDELALKATGREPVDKTDNMAVRRRMLKRKQQARKGALYTRFTTETADLTAKASRTLLACVEELAELEAALTPTLPAKASHVTTEFAALQSRLDEIILVNFPKGWDDIEREQPDGVELPDSEPSTWSASLKIKVAAAQERVLAANAAAVAQAIAAIKADFFEEIKANIKGDIGFLDDDGVALRASLVEAVKVAFKL